MRTRPVTIMKICLLIAFCSWWNGVLLAQEDEKSWLDKPLTNWNQPDSPVPSAGESILDPECANEMRKPTAGPETEVVEAGWLLYKPFSIKQPLRYSSTTVIVACGQTEGMCRPGLKQAFVFFNGQFVGTASPTPAVARSTGDLEDIRMIGPTKIKADFSYYDGTEALCCPSHVRTVYYEIRDAGHSWVLVPTGQRDQRRPPPQ